MATLRQPHRNEAGFTLVELLITMAIMGFILAAVLGIYQVTQQSTFAGTAAEDAQVVTRLLLERIVADLQLLNSGRPTTGGAITAASATSVTFWGDVNNDTLDTSVNPSIPAKLTSAAASGATTVQVSVAQGWVVGKLFSVENGTAIETQAITAVAGTTLTLGAGLSKAYPTDSIVRSVEQVTYTWTNANGGTLTRTAGGVTDTLATNVPTFTLTYWTGAVPAVQVPNPNTQALLDTIKQVRISIACLAQAGDQTVVRAMMTTVRPRNL